MEETNPISCRFNVYDFKELVENVSVHFHVIKMKDSCFIWIGSSPATMSNLAIAMKTKYNRVPTAATIMGETADNTASCLACRLSKKCDKVIFVSYNLQSDPELLSSVEKRLFEEIYIQPDKF